MLAGKAADRYAKALYDTARPEGCLPDILSNFSAIKAAVAASPELRMFLADYMIPRSRRYSALEEIFMTRVHARMWQFIRFLESRKRCGLLADIADVFFDIHRRAEGVVAASIASAFPLEEQSVEAVSRAIGGKVSGKLFVTTRVNPNLIGGFTLAIEDILYDLSVSGALNKLRRNIGLTREERMI